MASCATRRGNAWGEQRGGAPAPKKCSARCTSSGGPEERARRRRNVPAKRGRPRTSRSSGSRSRGARRSPANSVHLLAFGGSGAASEVVARPGGGAGARGRRLGSGSTSNAMSAGARAAARARRAGRPASEYLRLSRARVHYGTARRNRLLEGSKLGVGSDVRPSNVADGSRVAGQGRGRSKYLLLSQRFTRNSYTVGLDFGLRTLGAATRRPSTALNGCTRSLTTARPRG